MRQISTLLILLSFILSSNGQSNITSFQLASPALNGTNIPVDVYLPDGYDPMNSTYPLYLFLHGCCGDAPANHLPLFTARLDTLIGAGLVEPMVVAFPSIQGADYGNRHMYLNSTRNGQYGDAVVEDLMGYLSNNFAIRQEATERAIGGFSMGGDGAWRLGLANPDSFGYILSHGAFPALSPFPQIFIPAMLSENGGMAPYSFSPTAGAISNLVFGVSSAWSPNPMNAPYQLDLPVKPDGNLDTSVFQSWFPIADVNTLIRSQWNPQSLPQSFYFDVGRQMPLLLPSNELLKLEFDTLTQDGYSLTAKALIFEEPHQLSQARIDTSLIWLSQQLSKPGVAIEPMLSPLEFLAIPLPANQSISISWIPQHTTAHIELLDLQGRLVNETFLDATDQSQLEIPVGRMAPGIYTIRFRLGNKRAYKKLIWQW
jgi:S-formylglutathione hydrolase FrmB